MFRVQPIILRSKSIKAPSPLHQSSNHPAINSLPAATLSHQDYTEIEIAAHSERNLMSFHIMDLQSEFKSQLVRIMRYDWSAILQMHIYNVFVFLRIYDFVVLCLCIM